MQRRITDEPLRSLLLGLGLLLFDLLVVWRLPNLGAMPYLLPLFLVCLCLRRDVTGSVRAGIFVGLLAVCEGRGTWLLFVYPLLAAGLALLYRYGLQRSFLGALPGCVLCLGCLSILQIFWYWTQYRASFFAPFSLLFLELLQSLLYFPGLYLLCHLLLGRPKQPPQEVYA